MRYSIVFPCVPGWEAISSLLLAASLKRYLRCDHELIACVPGQGGGISALSPAVVAQLTALGVRIEAAPQFSADISDNLHALACLRTGMQGDRLIVIAGDMLCTREFTPGRHFDAEFCARPCNGDRFDHDGDLWTRAYERCGLQMPDLRTVATVSQRMVPPCFDTGLFATSDPAALADAWLECLRALGDLPALTNRPADALRMALPLALQKRGMRATCLDEHYNYPVVFKPVDATRMPLLCRHGGPLGIEHEPALKNQVAQLLKDTPGIRALIEADTDWRVVTRPWRFPADSSASGGDAAPPAARDGLITGIPRSGTSYLITLLGSTGRSLAINEPSILIDTLASELVPWGVARYHREIRCRVLAGDPIPNIMKNGALSEDTRFVHGREWYSPDIAVPDFMVLTKHTLPYIVRIKEVKRALPKAVIIACIRNPFDTIASWINSFDNLKTATVETLKVGNPSDPFLSNIERMHVAHIAGCQSLPVRRALYWRFLAETVLRHRSDLLVLRYEDTVADPGGAVLRILQGAGQDTRREDLPAFEASAPRSKRDCLSDEDIAAINALCVDVAMQFGYTEQELIA